MYRILESYQLYLWPPDHRLSLTSQIISEGGMFIIRRATEEVNYIVARNMEVEAKNCQAQSKKGGGID